MRTTEYDGNGKAIPEHLTRLYREALAADAGYSAILEKYGWDRWVASRFSEASGFPSDVRKALERKIRADAAWRNACSTACRQGY